MALSRSMKIKVALLGSAMILAPSSAMAEVVVSAYGGIQSAVSSNVSGHDDAPGGVGSFDFDQRWNGDSFKHPLYWGLRGTWWIDSLPNWGVSFDYTHAKVYADPMPDGWQTFEFTDGLNIFTLNALYRFKKEDRRWTPYVGLGAGISMPHVEVQTSTTAPKTFEYEIGGPAFQAQAGIDFRITDWLSVFGEYKGNYTINDTDLKGGGRLKTDIFTNAFDVGLSYHFN